MGDRKDSVTKPVWAHGELRVAYARRIIGSCRSSSLGGFALVAFGFQRSRQ